jgi:hypothetical protein
MKRWYDTEHGTIVTESELYDNYLENHSELERREISFREYICNCQTWNNGTLEEIKE